MSELDELEELHSALQSGGRKSRSRRTSHVNSATTATTTANETATPANAMDRPAADAVTTSAASTVSSITPIDDALSTTATSVTRPIPPPAVISELEQLRLENAELRAKLRSSLAAATTSSSIPEPSSSVIPVAPHAHDTTLTSIKWNERPKASIIYQDVSQRVRKDLDTWIMRAGYEAHTAKQTSSSPIQYFQSFCIDRVGIRPLDVNMYQPLDYQLFDVPTYEGPINIVPLPVLMKDNDEDMDIMGMLGTCFNCGQSHQLRECPHSRDERCIRVNSTLFREFAQGRNRNDGTISGGGGGRGGGPSGSGFQGRYYEDETLKSTAATTFEAKTNMKESITTITNEHEEGEIVLDEEMEAEEHKDSSTKIATTDSTTDDYFMHAIHPAIKHATAESLLATLPKSDLQVIDKDEDQLKPLIISELQKQSSNPNTPRQPRFHPPGASTPTTSSTITSSTATTSTPLMTRTPATPISASTTTHALSSPISTGTTKKDSKSDASSAVSFDEQPSKRPRLNDSLQSTPTRTTHDSFASPLPKSINNTSATIRILPPSSLPTNPSTTSGPSTTPSTSTHSRIVAKNTTPTVAPTTTSNHHAPTSTWTTTTPHQPQHPPPPASAHPQPQTQQPQAIQPSSGPFHQQPAPSIPSGYYYHAPPPPMQPPSTSPPLDRQPAYPYSQPLQPQQHHVPQQPTPPQHPSTSFGYAPQPSHQPYPSQPQQPQPQQSYYPYPPQQPMPPPAYYQSAGPPPPGHPPYPYPYPQPPPPNANYPPPMTQSMQPYPYPPQQYPPPHPYANQYPPMQQPPQPPPAPTQQSVFEPMR